MRTKFAWAVAICALLPLMAFGQTDIFVEDMGTVERPTVEAQVVADLHYVHMIQWTDGSAASYNVYVSEAAITDVTADNVYRIGTQIPAGQQAYEYPLQTPFTPGDVTNFYAVTGVSASGTENTTVTAGVSASTAGVSGTTDFAQPMFWFIDAPVVDGDFGDWPFEPVYADPESPDNFCAGDQDGPSDISGYVASGLDADYLYYRAEITDDALVNTVESGDGSIWQGDCVEWYLGLYDLRPSKPFHNEILYGNETDPSAAEPDWQMNIAGNAFDDPQRTFLYNAGKAGDLNQPMGNYGMEVLTQETAEGWSIEASIPWEGLAVDQSVVGVFQPKVGLIMSSSFAIADGDDPEGGRQAQLFWSSDESCNNLWQTPATRQREQVIYDPRVFGLGPPPTAVAATSWGAVKAATR